MPKTYYDSELTGAQIESALEAIHGVVTSSNNGKVLCIDNGAISAKSASEWGHGAVLEPLSVTANGDYTPPTGTDGFDSVHVAVPSATLTTKSITQNGTYNASSDNADGYSSVTVNVSGGGSAVVQPLSVTQNGTYTPPSGVDGYAPVTVNVSGGGADPFALTDYIESSGTQYIDTGYTIAADTKIEIVANIDDSYGNFPDIFGTRIGYGNNEVSLLWLNRGSSRSLFAWNNRTSPEEIQFDRTPYSGNKSLIIASKDGFRLERADWWIANGYTNTYASTPVNQHPLFIFGLNDNGSVNSATLCKMKLYRCRIFNGATLVHEFIPWQENGVACLKDTVTSEIKYNAGTGDFVYGTDT